MSESSLVSSMDIEETLPLSLEMYVDSDGDDSLIMDERLRGSFSCSQCDEQFKDIQMLQIHMQTHHDMEHWICPVCEMTFPAIFYLKEHMKNHNQTSPFNCAVCSFEFPNSDELKRHVRCHMIDNCKCEFCDKDFDSLIGLENHMCEHPEANVFMCNICPKTFHLAKTLEMHKQSHDMERYAASSIETMNPNAELANLNMQLNKTKRRANGQGKLYMCDICKKIFRHSSYFQLHMRAHTGDKSYSCEYCRKSFTCSWNLKTHLAIHKDEKPYSCSVCGVSFKLKANMQRHERSHRLQEKLKAVSCQYNSYNASLRNQTLNSNGMMMSISAQDKQLQQMNGTDMCSSNLGVKFSCGLCNQSFSDQQMLTQHSCYSRNGTPHTCNICSKSFPTLSHLTSHLSTHTNERPYSCSVCGMGFKIKANLLRHERLHQPSGSNMPSNQDSSVLHLPSVNNTSVVPKLEQQVLQCQNPQSSGMLLMPGSGQSNIPDISFKDCQEIVLPQGRDLMAELGIKDEFGHNPSKLKSLQSFEDITAQGHSNAIQYDHNLSLQTNKLVEIEQQYKDIKNDPNNTLSMRRHACNVCGKAYKQRCHLLSHMVSHTGERPYTCDYCGKCFSFSWNLKTHMAVHNDEKPFTCTLCGNSFKLKSALQRHERMHIWRKDYINMASRQEMNNSQPMVNPLENIKHPDPSQINIPNHTVDQNIDPMRNGAEKMPVCATQSENVHLCGVCNKSFPNSNDFFLHMESHAAEIKQLPCEICGKTFACSSNLRIHQATHQDDRPHSCNTCGSGFKLKSSLQRHQRIHKGELPYTCVHCGKSFVESGALKCHIRIHTGERPYPCKQCGKKFVDSGALKRHVRTHTGEKPYSCDSCDKRFTTSSQLNNHTRTHR